MAESRWWRDVGRKWEVVLVCSKFDDPLWVVSVGFVLVFGLKTGAGMSGMAHGSGPAGRQSD